MFKEKIEKIKSVINKEDDGGKTSKKKIENLVIFIIILIITIISINTICGKDNSNSEKTNNNKQLAYQNSINNNTVKEDINSTELETNLQEILSKINGVGKVNVLITYSESSQIVAMYNENTKETSTEEKDTAGGTRLIKESDTQKDVIYKEENGQKEPITQKKIMPKIEGAIVIAQGASNVTTKTNIIQAIEATTGLAAHKIQVFEMKKD